MPETNGARRTGWRRHAGMRAVLALLAVVVSAAALALQLGDGGQPGSGRIVALDPGSRRILDGGDRNRARSAVLILLGGAGAVLAAASARARRS